MSKKNKDQDIIIIFLVPHRVASELLEHPHNM